MKATIREPSFNRRAKAFLSKMRADWQVYGQDSLEGTNKEFDILIDEEGARPVVIELEFEKGGNEDDARGRLGITIYNKKITAAIALLIPERFHDYVDDDRLDREIVNANDLKYILLIKEKDEIERFPSSGWLVGSLVDVAQMVQAASVSRKQIDECTKYIVSTINIIKDVIEKQKSDTKKEIAAILSQKEGEQTWKMAALVLSNAMVFYELLSGANGIKTTQHLKTLNKYSQDLVMKAWKHVLSLNYHAIFSVARDILKEVEEPAASKIIDEIVNTASTIHRLGLRRSSDLYGTLLQETIRDRKLLASFYTKPESAALLAHLSIPKYTEGVWKNRDMVKHLRIADFACGTGTLLTSAYRQVIVNYELNNPGSGMRENHADMMKNVFIGADILPVSTHLTVSALGGMFPNQKFKKSSIMTLKFGRSGDHYKLGSLNLINTNTVLDAIGMRVDSKDAHEVKSIEVADNSCDVVIMNPPYTSDTKSGNDQKRNAVPSLAAFGTSASDQKAMGKLKNSMFRNTCADGNAGLATNFFAIADKKLSYGGTIGIVLPSTVAFGFSWKKVRSLINHNYEDAIIISIADTNNKDSAFSADTSMSEVLLIAKKCSNEKIDAVNDKKAILQRYEARYKILKDEVGRHRLRKTIEEVRQSLPKSRGLFVSLPHRPISIVEAIEIGKHISRVDGILTLDDGTRGGSTIGNGGVGGLVLDCPLDESEWAFTNVYDPVLTQMIFQLKQKKLCLQHEKIKSMPITALEKIAVIGPLRRDVTDRGPFKKIEIRGRPKYPTLWNNSSGTQKSMMIKPDFDLERKPQATNQEVEKLESAFTRLHVNTNFNYGSQVMWASYTTISSIGGRSWPSVILHNREYEKAFVVWGNTVFGILCYWYAADKQQPGKGNTTKERLPGLAVLDFDELDRKQLAIFNKLFDMYAKKQLQPAKYLYRDDIRKRLDREVLNALGIDASESTLDNLRNSLCGEPSINNGSVEPELKEALWM